MFCERAEQAAVSAPTFFLLLSHLLPRSFNFLEVHNFFPWGASPAAGPLHVHFPTLENGSFRVLIESKSVLGDDNNVNDSM